MNGHRRLAVAAALTAALAAALVGAAGTSAGAAPGPPQCVRSLDIGDKTAAEGTRTSTAQTFYTYVSFPVVSTGCSRETTVSWATMGLTASSIWDFVPTTGTLTFPGGSHATRWITIPVIKDGSPGSNETYWVYLHSPSGGTVLGDSIGTGTIINDDLYCVPPPEVQGIPDYHCSE